ncbi:hypothetical protein EHQ53_03880 [Leptospira langatensis]|uniref:Uncharacterized protein n=1 Tax=Leptospira langatensis TaxID=2484983 RepID=A0A5F2A0J1_9LEPT|nr:hypothetical protein [Leptospira langatensis]TGK04297.1 hypothetical protein EHO57_04110 [Leptospira langatensis]TGL43777.1 hypothetical protein EHQ53_03880 [Leptospira langatensis]
MLENARSTKYRVFLLTFLLFILGGSFALSSQTSSNRKDAPIGIIAYCPAQSEKEKPFDFERTLSLWYKRFKAERIQEGGGAILLVSAPYLSKDSPEIERIKTALGAEIVFAGFHSAKVEKKQPGSSNTKKVKSSKKQTKKIRSKKPTTKPEPKESPKETPGSVVWITEIPNASGQAQETQKSVPSSEKTKTDTSAQAPSKETSSPKSTETDLKKKKTNKVKSTSSISSQKKEKKGSKKKLPKLSKKADPIIPPGQIISKEEGGLNFVFYSPALQSLQSKDKSPAPWIEDFKTQFNRISEFHNFHFLLAQDPTPDLKNQEGRISSQLEEWRKDLLAELPSVVLVSSPQSLRFFNGEYSFGCGATADSLKINILQLFFRNGRLIRISEEVQDLNSKESNKSWILE